MIARRLRVAGVTLAVLVAALAGGCDLPGHKTKTTNVNENVGPQGNQPAERYLWLTADTSMPVQPDFSVAFDGAVTKPPLPSGDFLGPWESFARQHDGVLTDRMVVSMTIGTKFANGSVVRDIVLSKDCAPALRGTKITLLNEGGPMDVQHLYFDLSRTYPRGWTARLDGKSDDDPPVPYFEGNQVLDIDNKESVAVALTITGTDQDCGFTISVIYEHDGKRYRQDIAQPTQGMPFRITPGDVAFQNSDQIDIGG